ncbi:DNA-directed RNA polymerase I subunit RPA43 isoform X1 [Phyllostomus discolor]|uniref:DNA-directed RNA polymerase subunit n=1 Tax=Phyllostomus discolor TaxID=89673 RepID=A0A7E6CHY3_9CHIR|nr:DNA-directed RNA polymerase I subunit RPA43 isoform X1 [Phyllostomus discolor]
MAAGCSESPRPKTASEGPVVGPAGVLPCLELPTYAAACALLNSRYSCLVAGPHRRHIALSPRYLHRKRTGIREQLDAELLRYSESLSGVPIAYDNIKVVGELGDIYDDQGYIHLNIEADFVIFCPEPGQKLLGAVNKVSSSHIGCLVHGCFNASIPKPEHMPAEQWQGLEINVGDELEFEVFRLDSDAAGVFCIRGKLNITSLQAKCSAVSEEVTEAGPEEVFEKPLKKKKKKKKDPEPDEGAGGTTEPADFAGVPVTEETDPWVNSSVNGFWDGEPKKKKKKKKKDPEPGEGAGGTTEPADFAGVPETEETDPQVNSSVNGLWDGEPRKKKKKKKKKDPEPSEGAGGTTEPADSAGVPMTEETDPQVNSSVNGLWDGEPGKKKKEQHQEDQDQDPVFPASDSSGYQSDHKKKKKKRKHSEEAEFTPLLEHSPRKKRKQ